MPAIAYDKQLAEFRSQLRNKERERETQIARFDDEIANLKKIIESLTVLAKQPTTTITLTANKLDDAILEIFSGDTSSKMPPKKVLKKLLTRGFDLSGFSNRMAYVHASLKRLYRKGFLNKETVEDSGSIYQLKTLAPDAIPAKVAEIRKKA